MKNSILKLTIVAGLGMTMSSCSDFLNEPILGQQDLTNYFATEEECEKHITGCYSYLG